ncbi:MAG TPA: pyridoxal-phosphate dependent enzyme [Planctomycetota bacterium]
MASSLPEMARLDVRAAARRLAGVVRETELLPFALEDGRLELRLKLECRQETNSFKARGAWNQVVQLTAPERAAGVVTTSSGNHGRALAWAARRAGVGATIVMPASTYPNKIEACRAEGAEVVLCPTREEAEAECARRVAAGAVLVHPYKQGRTIEGAGTVGLELARQWPEVEVALFPTGGGGLVAGSALALATELGERVQVIGVEPEGAPNLTQSLEAGAVVPLARITTQVQGLCPLDTGELNLALAERFLRGTVLLTDEEILAGQRILVKAGLVVEPAGAAAFAAVLHGALPPELLEGRSAANPLRVAAVLSGGNPDPAQLARISA